MGSARRVAGHRLASTFRGVPGRPELVGVEIEAAVVDPRSGVSLPYDGARGVRSLLALVAERWTGTPLVEAGELIGFRRPDGAEIMLESGCALEYGSAPAPRLGDLVPRVREDMTRLAHLAAEAGVALLSGALMPYNGPGHRTWAPKAQIPLMLGYFDRHVPGSSGWAAMSRILSVQTTLDYTDPADRDAKHRMANAVSPLVAALFVNSPVWEGAPTGLRSQRLRVWQRVDRTRAGFLPHSLDYPLDPDKYLDTLTGLPPIFRRVAGISAPAPDGKAFRELLEHGYGDGTYPDESDWKALLSTLWPYVRLRDTLELRVADGPHYTDWAAVPTLWTALGYDPTAREEAAALMRGRSVDDLDALIDDVAIHGLEAHLDGIPIRQKCADLVTIAHEGLTRLVASGREPEDVLTYLAPLDKIAASGQTAADRLLADWPTTYAENPAAYVTDHRWR
ncbi:glutamate-cysteine ligase family protein [Actinocorallia sp. API 0066]|uniref:glutamate-cysteine ligase family protein n=1 Tax=Actinocorallia sp. API 0066 TaxID=2896846 RepID=UPI001E35DFD5|nr:glutamate-cysteine ligase family protein [Actinocorallia sp. API 0066]MCD0451265.1 glutamate-cysteine ligase family protein [Actinocorallia sp. API 0066]